jgi:hypothetical protein
MLVLKALSALLCGGTPAAGVAAVVVAGCPAELAGQGWCSSRGLVCPRGAGPRAAQSWLQPAADVVVEGEDPGSRVMQSCLHA